MKPDEVLGADDRVELPDEPRWGVNFQRTVRRKNEKSYWTGWGLNQGLRIQYTGLLLGIRDVSQGYGLELRPYGVATAAASPGRGSTATTADADAGVDPYYSVTPAVRANLTVNTDFAQTEVDQRQVNLSCRSLRAASVSMPTAIRRRSISA